MPVLFDWGYFSDKTDSFPPALLEALEAASEGRVAKSTLAGYGEPVKAPRKPPRSIAPGRASSPTSLAPPPERSKLPMILAIVTVLALGGGVAAWFISQRPVEVTNTPQVNTPPVTGVVDAGGQPQVAVAPAEAVDAGPEGPAMTVVRVETRPEGASVEAAARVCTVALCLRGTVTQGRMELTEVVSLGGRPDDELVAMATAR